MAALAYLLLPLTGMLAFFSWAGPRVRFHGAQSIAFGVVWPLAMYVCSALSATATQIVFVLGGAVWLFLIVATALGRDPKLPVVGSLSARAAGLDGEVG